MADAAVTFVMDQLAQLIREEYSLLGEVREDAEDIKNALDRLRAALRVADEMEEIDPQAEAWVKIVRELAYDTEDVLDEFLFRFGGCRTSRGFYTKIKNIYTCIKDLRARHNLALALRRIKARVNDNSQYQPSLPTNSIPTLHNQNKMSYDSREDARLLEESDLVGIQNPKQFLIGLLLAVDNDLKVHSVVGMGGLGKTTLVKMVYDDVKVINHFQHRLWVTVSETYKIEELLKDAIKQLVKQTNQALPQDFVAMDLTELKEFIRSILSGRKYIIVLDDIWDINAWMAMKYAFPKQKFGSRIVITTRNHEIGQDASHETQGAVYPLKVLSHEDSWTLFCRKTFLDGSCPQHLVNISKNILNRCNGLPLAIVVMAGVLATKGEGIEAWERFECSLNIQLERNVKMKNLNNLLSLSYYDLPYYLKYCFLYLSIFPEDAIINKMRVIRLWIAEGFVSEHSPLSKEEVADGYIHELLHRNLIQTEEKTYSGSITSFRVHDILRQIMLSKSTVQNFAIIATGQDIEPSNKFRRLAIHSFDENILKSSSSSKKHLRSLQLFETITSSMVPLSSFKLLVGGFIRLKVLDLRCIELEEIPEEVFNLFLLKYLSLRHTKVRNVPKSIGRLRNLETLDLKHTNVIELPAEISKLCKLRHLLVFSDPVKGFIAPFGIGGLLSLQNLYNIGANDSRVVCEIGKLTQLRKLGVTNLGQECGKEFCSSLEKLTNLFSLSLGPGSHGEFLDSQIPLFAFPPCLRAIKLEGYLQKVPQWLSSFVSLTKLYLMWSKLEEDPLPFLHDLPMLAHLHLLKSYVGEGLCFKAQKFSKLKLLIMDSLEKLKWIKVEEGAMPLLERLIIRRCKSLEQVPLGIQHLSKLEKIAFVDLDDELMLTLEDSNAENYANISHIPQIYVLNKYVTAEEIFV